MSAGTFGGDVRRVLQLGLPILAGQLGMIVTGFADTIMVGRYATEALAAASFVNNVFNCAIFACIGFTYGLTPLVGALYGQQRPHDIGALARTAVVVNTLFALLVTVVMGTLYLFLHRLGQPPELLPLIRPYYILQLLSVLPITLFNTLAQASYGINDTRMPMWIILGANALNILLNWLLIYGHLGLPELGLTGAGLATFAARVASLAALAGILMRARRYGIYRHGYARARYLAESARRVASLSWPVSLQMTFESGSFTVAAIMTGWLGAVPLAAFQVIVIIGTLGFCVYYSMGSAVSVLVSNAAGCDDHGRMRAYARAGYAVTLLLALAASLFFLLGGRHSVGIFTDDPAVVTAATALLLPLMAYQLGDATQITFASALRGTARVMPMMWVALVSYVVVGIPATYVLGFTLGGGVHGIVLSFSVSLLLAGALYLYFFRRATTGAGSECRHR